MSDMKAVPANHAKDLRDEYEKLKTSYAELLAKYKQLAEAYVKQGKKIETIQKIIEL